MAKEGRKLELYEILAAKRAKGKQPLGLDSKLLKPANGRDEEAPGTKTTGPEREVIVDDSLGSEFAPIREEVLEVSEAPASGGLFPRPRETRRGETRRGEPRRAETRILTVPAEEPAALEPAPEPRRRSPREVVFALDTAFIFFTVVLALVGSAYFLGYKRGQEERPTGLAGVGDIEVSDPARLTLRNPVPVSSRATVRPAEQDFTLILRTEPAADNQPDRLELELAEAVAVGKQKGAGDVSGFIFRTEGNDPRYVLAVGLGKSANDAELNRLRTIYYQLEGVTLSREPRPYVGCRIAPVKDLGTLVN